MRVPVGYWIMDAPVGGSSPLEYGISPEGFVTGGLNSLYKMLVALRKRGIAVQLDMHAMVCNSACISDGMYCAEALAFAPPGSAPIGEIARCGGGTYKTTRVPRAGEASWGDVGVNALGAMAKWVAALPDEAAAVAALQLANEPALAADGGLGGPSKAKEDASTPKIRDAAAEFLAPTFEAAKAATLAKTGGDDLLHFKDYAPPSAR